MRKPDFASPLKKSFKNAYPEMTSAVTITTTILDKPDIGHQLYIATGVIITVPCTKIQKIWIGKYTRTWSGLIIK